MTARHNRDLEKEKYWREQLALQKKSGLSQAIPVNIVVLQDSIAENSYCRSRFR
jgi:hypothetical protein